MENVTLEVFAVDSWDSVCFRRLEPTGPGGVRFSLLLPSTEVKESNCLFGKMVDLVEAEIMDNDNFPWSIDFINVRPGKYNEDAMSLLSQYLRDFPLEDSCRLSAPVKLIWG